MRLQALLASTALIVTIPTAALAQETGAAGETEESTGLDEIVVTAQFKRENLQRAAIAVDVVGGDDIARGGVTSPTQLTTVVPALQVSQSGAGAQSLFIRGVGTLTANSYSDPGVAFNVDGIYIGRPTSMRNTFFDIERVEVLKGPQGTLYGRNATGGAINVLPVKPRIGELGGTFGAGYGNYNDLHLDAAINVPLGSNAAARISGTINEHDGYLSDGTNDAKSWAIRGQLLFEPTDAISIRLSGDYSHDGGLGYGSVISAYINPLTGATTLNPLARDVGLADPRSSAIFSGQYSFLSGRFGRGIVEQPFTDNNYWGIKAEVGADLGFANLTVLASKRGSSLNSLDLGVGFPAYTDQKDDQFSLEARLASPDEGVFRWLIGGYYYDENISTNYQFNLYSLTSLQQLDTGTSTTAGFARVTIAPTDNLRLVGGIRYTHENKRFVGVNDVFLDICTLSIPPIPACPTAPFFSFAPTASQLITNMNLIQVNPGPPAIYIQPTAAAANTIFQRGPIPVNESLKTNRTTFRAAVEYDVGPDNLLYASFENGFHAGGFAFALISRSYGPESIDAYTIGSKNRFLDGKLQINVEAFLWKYRNQQISHFATDINGALVFITENAGSSTNKGFEISTQFRPMRNTTLRFDVQYLDAKYDTFTYRAPTAPAPLITGCPVTPVSATIGQANCSGFRALRSPEWTINAGIEQVIPVGAYRITLAADTHYQSDSVIGFEMLPTVSEQKGYFVSNASIEFGPDSGKWSIGAFVNNIEDNRPFGQSAFNNQFDTFTSSPLPPRTYGVRARVNF
jgi:iron complex outermembrane recepter protein